MRNGEFNKKQVIKYLIWTFAIAYIIQFAVAPVYNNGSRAAAQLVLAAMMFVPLLGVLLSGGKLKGMGWNPQVPNNVKYILTAWFLPMVLTAIGAALYFLVFPGHFDLSGGYIVSGAGAEALSRLQEKGLSYTLYFLLSLVSAVTYGPLINMFAAVGEEVGWRGFLYPQLKARFGRRKGRLLGGVIWGVWHWPLIGLIGYEYGAAAGNSAGYAGFPVTGMLLYCVSTVGLGILHDWLYEKSQSIWVAALFHGAITAAATIPLALCDPEKQLTLLGPGPQGLLAGLPFLALGLAMCSRPREEE